MVETAIYILLGALSSALLALLALPAVSRRAYRLAQRRAELSAPLSAAEARAERDALRARHAVELARVERRTAQAQENWASAQIALGRQATELVRRDETLARQTQEIESQREEPARLGAELRALETEIGARETALRDAFEQRDAAQRRLSEIVARLEGAQTLAEQERAHRASLQQQIAALTRELEDARADESPAFDDPEQRPDLPSLWLPKARAADLHALEPADEGIDHIHGRLAEAATRENDLSLRVKALAAGRHEAEAALRGAKTERDAARRELARMRDADAELRAAIARLGHAWVERHEARSSGQSLISQS